MLENRMQQYTFYKNVLASVCVQERESQGKINTYMFRDAVHLVDYNVPHLEQASALKL